MTHPPVHKPQAGDLIFSPREDCMMLAIPLEQNDQTVARLLVTTEAQWSMWVFEGLCVSFFVAGPQDTDYRVIAVESVCGKLRGVDESKVGYMTPETPVPFEVVIATQDVRVVITINNIEWKDGRMEMMHTTYEWALPGEGGK